MTDEKKGDDRLVHLEAVEQKENHDFSLRPKQLKEFIGQPQVQKNLSTFISAASSRQEPMDHALLFGPPGLGKTTLAQIISFELGVGFRSTSGPIINKAGDLAALLTNLKPKDVLFIDDLCELILKQIKSYHIFQNNLFCIGGGLKNSINLKNLTRICEKLTNNKVKITNNMSTSIYDIPYYVTSLQKIKKFTKWEPKISLNEGMEITYNWMKKNQTIIRKFF